MKRKRLDFKWFGWVLLGIVLPISPSMSKGVDSPIYQHLLQQAKTLLAERAELVSGLTSAASLEQRRDWVREKMVESFGGFPEKTPLNPQTLWTKEFDGYRIEGVVYESQPGLHVTANLYIPTSGTPPYPAVLGPCGHSILGKAAETYQPAWINLARRGFVVLSFDPVGQGERMAYLDEQGKARFGPTTEHTHLGVLALLVGTNVARDFIWDGIRSIDYLESRPEVDPERIGCTGNSGGGTQTAYLMAVDPRIKAAAPSCYITSLEKLLSTIGPQDAEQNLKGQIALGIDHADYVEACLPRPVLIATARDDYFDIDGAWSTYREAKNFYQRYGVPERVDLIEAPDEHGFSIPRRTRVYHWMAQWLKSERDEAPEPDTPILPAEELLCTPTGQTVTAFEGARTLRDIYRDRAEELRRERRERNLAFGALREEIAEILRVDLASPRNEWSQVGFRPWLKKQSYVAEVEPGWVLHTEVHSPEGEAGDSIILYLGDAAHSIENLRNEPARLAAAGEVAAALTLRGLGSENRLQGGGLHRYFGDFPLFFLSYQLDRPLVGQRVSDILACVDLLAKEFEGKTVRIRAEGEAVPPALLAAALDDRIAEVHGTGGLASWESIFKASHSLDCLSNIAPGMLTAADLPDLVSVILPRKVILEDCVSPIGEPLAKSDLEAIYLPLLEDRPEGEANLLLKGDW